VWNSDCGKQTDKKPGFNSTSTRRRKESPQKWDLVMLQKSKRPRANGAQKNPPATVPAEISGAFKLKPAARYLGGLSVPTMHRLIDRGLLRPNRALRHLIFSKAELDRFLAEYITADS
jgi:Helix-turn-helix domain